MHIIGKRIIKKEKKKRNLIAVGRREKYNLVVFFLFYLEMDLLEKGKEKRKK